jgi:hypothetical protein
VRANPSQIQGGVYLFVEESSEEIAKNLLSFVSCGDTLSAEARGGRS